MRPYPVRRVSRGASARTFPALRAGRCPRLLWRSVRPSGARDRLRARAIAASEPGAEGGLPEVRRNGKINGRGCAGRRQKGKRLRKGRCRAGHRHCEKRSVSGCFYCPRHRGTVIEGKRRRCRNGASSRKRRVWGGDGGRGGKGNPFARQRKGFPFPPQISLPPPRPPHRRRRRQRASSRRREERASRARAAPKPLASSS